MSVSKVISVLENVFKPIETMVSVYLVQNSSFSCKNFFFVLESKDN